MGKGKTPDLSAIDIERARRVLICLRYGIGDVVMQMPAIESLRRAAPGAWIQAIGARPAIELLDSDPRLNDVADVNSLGFLHWADEGDREIGRRAHRWLNEGRYDVVLNPSDAVFGLRKILWERSNAIYDTDVRKVRAALKAGKPGIAALNAGTGSGWGIQIPADRRPRLYLSSEHHEHARWLLGENLAASGLLAVSPVASSPLKRWPLERLAEVADRLLSRFGWDLLILCGPQRELGEQLLSSMRYGERALSVGAVHLSTVAALLSRAKLFIGNDTGLMHLSSAVGTPTLSIFGPTVPAVYCPPAPWSAAVVGRDIDCRHRHTEFIGPPGCWASEHCLIGPQSCVNRVELDEVVEAACDLLDTVGQPNPHPAEEEPTRVSTK